MPIVDKEKRQEYINKWKREARRKRGLQKQGRKPYTEEQKIEADKKKKEYQLQWNKDHPWHTKRKESRLLWAAKKRAKEEDVPFSITIEDIIIPTHCPYLGIELTNHVPRGEKRNNVASLDKIIPSLGYVKGNIEVMSQQANTMKSDASKEELLKFALEIIKRYG